MFTISNRTDYAMLLIQYLKGRKKPVSMAVISFRLKLPRRYLARIAADLTEERILKSKEGVKGGYILAKSLKNIKLYDVLRLFEGDVALTKCCSDSYKCKWKSQCKHSKYWSDILTNKFVDVIKKITLNDVLN